MRFPYTRLTVAGTVPNSYVLSPFVMTLSGVPGKLT